MKKKRQSTVEPVFGTLMNFTGMRKVNTLGIANANKVMIMAGVAYNIKKYLKFTARDAANKGRIRFAGRVFNPPSGATFSRGWY